MTAIAARRRPTPASTETLIGALAIGIGVLILLALGRQLIHGRLPIPHDRTIWLAVHLASVIPALPLGAWVLLRRKGDRTHRLLGRVWAVLMIVAALSSFGLTSLMGRLSPIHLLSLLTLVGIARGVWLAIRGDVANHRRTMLRVYYGLLGAGIFAFVPGRLLGIWLFG